MRAALRAGARTGQTWLMSQAVVDGTWLNEPGRWRSGGLDTLAMTTDAGTGFWRTTHYGYVRDNGHLFGRRVSGDFVAEVTVRGAYAEQYDQAGLMVRLDAERWVKAGVELLDGRQHLSVVVTHGVSDWSVLRLAEAPAAMSLRVTRSGDALQVESRPDGRLWSLHRLAFFPAKLPVLVGPMACSPDGVGFDVSFSSFRVDPR